MLVALLALALFGGQPAERVVDVRVQGNTLTSDADIVRMSGLQTGAAVTPTLVEDTTARLKAAGRFRRVEVTKRYASIADLSQILLVIIVDEGPVVVRPMKDGQPARTVRRRGPPLMYLPILGSEEGYAFSYGVLVSMPNVAGPRTRVSVPLTWGGERRAAVELEKRLDSPRLTRIRVGGTVLRRDSAAFGVVDSRRQVWVRGEREIARALRLGAWSGVDAVSFGSDDSRVVRLGVDAAFDTRVDPWLARNAVYARAAVERLAVQKASAPVRTLVDASGYLGFLGSSTIVVRVYRDGASQPVPGYLKVLRGRESTLRGYAAAREAGDTTAAATLELRVPLTSPPSVGKLGVRAFVDTASVYDAGEHLSNQRFARGVGGGVWFTATVIRLALDVAHGSGGSTRVQLSSAMF